MTESEKFVLEQAWLEMQNLIKLVECDAHPQYFGPMKRLERALKALRSQE